MSSSQVRPPVSGQPVRSLQSMLSQLAQRIPVLPRLTVDGVFGEKTLEAVMLFQREFQLPVTGLVDGDTYARIRSVWMDARRALTDSRPVRVFPSEGYRAFPGAQEVFLVLPQTMFHVLSQFFTGIALGPGDGVHTRSSVENVRWLQRAGGLEDTGVLDPDSWELLCRLYEAVVVWAPSMPGVRTLSPGWG